MILKDLLNRIEDNTSIRILGGDGAILMDYEWVSTLDERYNDYEVIFPISVKDNTIEIWIDTM